MEQQPTLQKVNVPPVIEGLIESDIGGEEKNIPADLPQGRTGREKPGFPVLNEKDK
jgi:hypothetical protein